MQTTMPMRNAQGETLSAHLQFNWPTIFDAWVPPALTSIYPSFVVRLLSLLVFLCVLSALALCGCALGSS